MFVKFVYAGPIMSDLKIPDVDTSTAPNFAAFSTAADALAALLFCDILLSH